MTTVLTHAKVTFDNLNGEREKENKFINRR